MGAPLEEKAVGAGTRGKDMNERQGNVTRSHALLSHCRALSSAHSNLEGDVKLEYVFRFD